MFDVAFSELIVIALVALIVIGPERLPKVARTAGVLLGRLQRYVAEVKVDIQREMHIEELKKLQENVASQVLDVERSVAEKMKVIENDLNASLTAGIESKPQTTDPAAAELEQAPAPALESPGGAAAVQAEATAGIKTQA